MNLKRIGFWGVAMTLAGAACLLAEHERKAERSSRSGYSYLRESSGEVTVLTRYNGRVAARRNMPITAGDEIRVSEGGRAEIALADGNLLHVGGGTRARFVSLSRQQGEKDEVSAIDLEDGSVILAAVGTDEEALPRIDTEDATVYLEPGARVRVNADRRRGTVVIARQGSVEVRTREGRKTLRSGQYMIVRGEEEPEIARGSFSRDRFDLWSADRLEALYETRSASARYVDDDYDSDVVALDGYGDWSYNATYSTHVWTPRVSVGWTPYSYGRWYYTTAGLTWWPYDPWGWYPHHYGSWYFDSFWSRWCWVPSYTYSPAWVYWAYTPSYIGWCPTGYYSFYSPWYDTYYRHWGIHRRGGIYLSIHGTFSPRRVDFRGWNFADTNGFGTSVERMDVIPGSRITGRLGPEVAISSRPIVVSARGGSPREALAEHIRQAPRVIERTESPDSPRLAPILARERTLPAQTVEALRERTVVADRGGLAGPRAADLAPPGAFVERGRTIDEISREESPRSPGRGGRTPADREPADAGSSDVLRGRPATEGDAGIASPRPEISRRGRPVVSSDQDEGWRGRGRGATTERSESPRLEVEREPRGIDRAEDRSEEQSRSWRSRPPRAREATGDNAAPIERERASEAPRASEPDEGWRARPEAPPAVRVIERAVPGRRSSGRAREGPADESGAPEPRRIERQESGHARQPRSWEGWERRRSPRVREAPEASREQRQPREHRDSFQPREVRQPRGEVRQSPRGEHREAPRVREAPSAPREAPHVHIERAPVQHAPSSQPDAEPDPPPPAEQSDDSSAPAERPSPDR